VIGADMKTSRVLVAKVILALVGFVLLLSPRVDRGMLAIMGLVVWPYAHYALDNSTVLGIVGGAILMGILTMIVPAPASVASSAGAAALALLTVALWVAVLNLIEVVITVLHDRADHLPS
jgi:hypothetical protein